MLSASSSRKWLSRGLCRGSVGAGEELMGAEEIELSNSPTGIGTSELQEFDLRAGDTKEDKPGIQLIGCVFIIR